MESAKKALERRNNIRALVIEDDLTVRVDITNDLQKLGFSVDAFETPMAAASKISNQSYRLWVIDLHIKGDNIFGNEFVRKNKDVIKGSKIVAYTAHGAGLSEEDEKLFTKIFIKATDDKRLIAYAKNIYESSETSEVNVTDITKTTEWKMAKDRLLTSLFKTKAKAKDSKIIWYKENEWSAKELIDEVNDVDSEVGKSHIRMMFNWLKKKGGNK